MLGLDATYRVLRRSLEGSVLRDEPLARHTTYRIGGPAAIWIEADSTDDVGTALAILSENGIPFEVLGKGSNILASDEGYSGAILTLGPGLRGFKVSDTSITAGAGCVLGRLVREALSHSLTGLEFAVGIPGTLGGALAMNAGTRDHWMESVVSTVTAYIPDKGLVTLDGNEVQWDYRSSNLRDSSVICSATLELEVGDPDAIKAASELSLEKRRSTQPIYVPNAGSVFKNPEGDSVGRLIDSLGLKGHTIGGAQISTVHANFIVNIENASAHDVVALIELIQERVYDAYGIILRPEIRFLGSFKENL